MYKILPALLLFSSSVFSQSLTIDDSFDQGTGFEFNSELFTATELPQLVNNKLFISGTQDYYDNSPVPHILVLNSDGSVDSGFDCGDCANGYVYKSVLQDGKILIAGSFTEFNGTPRKYFARINFDGTLDTTFNANNIFDDSVNTSYIYQISVIGDGESEKIYIAGAFTEDGFLIDSTLIRLNYDGSLDTSFNFDDNSILPASNVVIRCFDILPDGKLIVGSEIGGIYRFNSDGSFDDTFTSFNTVVTRPRSILVTENSIFIGGHFFDNTNVRLLYKLNLDGTIDESFTVYNMPFDNYQPFINSINKIDNKIICSGQFDSLNGYDDFFAINEDGSFDSSFYFQGVASFFYDYNSYISEVLSLTNNKIAILGKFDLVGESEAVNFARLGFDNLGIDDFNIANKVSVYSEYETTYFSSVNNSISSIEFYDISGRLIDSAIVNSDVYSCTLSNNSLILYRIFLNDGAIVTGKVIR